MPKFSAKLFDTICDRIAQGESLRKICEADDMPATQSVYRWLDDDDALRDQYARAREMQADKLAEECVEIADEAVNCPDEDTSERINRARLRIDTRKWIAGKMRPKVYGDKVDLNHSGSFSVNISGDDADL